MDDFYKKPSEVKLPDHIHRLMFNGSEPSVDLRPNAARMANSVEAYLAKKRSNRAPLWVLVGEHHKTIEHHLFQLLLLEELKGRGVSFTVGLEFPHNFMSEISHPAHQDFKATTDTREQLRRGLTTGIPTSHAPQSFGRKVLYLFQNNVDTVFCDVARVYRTMARNEVLVDPDNIENLEFSKKNGFSLDKPLDLKSEKGLYLRNLFMINRLIKATKEKSMNERPDCLILWTGRGHITGLSATERPYRESLDKILRDHNIPVLSIINKLPAAGDCNFQQNILDVIKINPLPRTTWPKPFHSDPVAGEVKDWNSYCDLMESEKLKITKPLKTAQPKALYYRYQPDNDNEWIP